MAAGTFRRVCERALRRDARVRSLSYAYRYVDRPPAVLLGPFQVSRRCPGQRTFLANLDH
jgi:hypothetical protein